MTSKILSEVKTLVSVILKSAKIFAAIFLGLNIITFVFTNSVVLFSGSDKKILEELNASKSLLSNVSTAHKYAKDTLNINHDFNLINALMLSILREMSASKEKSLDQLYLTGIYPYEKNIFNNDYPPVISLKPAQVYRLLEKESSSSKRPYFYLFYVAYENIPLPLSDKYKGTFINISLKLFQGEALGALSLEEKLLFTSSTLAVLLSGKKVISLDSDCVRAPKEIQNMVKILFEQYQKASETSHSKGPYSQYLSKFNLTDIQQQNFCK